MTPYETELAEFSLVRTLPNIIVSEVKGRAKGKLEAVGKKIDKYWEGKRLATNKEIETAQAAIKQLQDITGWKPGNGKDIATLILFGQAVLEDADFEAPPGVFKALRDLILHFEDHPDPKKRPKPACYWAADLAAEKWQKIKKDIL